MTTFGVYTNGLGYSFTDMKRLWQAAEKAGFDSARTMDNSVNAIPGQPARPVYESYVVLSALAAVTSSIKLGPLVTPAGRRHPALLAKMTAVLDVISGGRFQLAMGSGDQAQLFRPWGMDFPSTPERIARLREEIEIVKLLWTEERVTYQGQYYALDGAINLPKPLQRPRPPIWVGIQFGRRLMPKLAAEAADGVNVLIGTDDDATGVLDAVRTCCEEIGREFDSMTRSRHLFVTVTDKPYDHAKAAERQATAEGLPDDYVRDYLKAYPRFFRHLSGSVDEIASALEEQKRLGFNYFLLQFLDPEHPLQGGIDGAIQGLEEFSRSVLPSFQQGGT